MTEAWKSIKLQEFEHVVTGSAESLLRVSGKPPRRGDPSPRPTLIIEGPVAEHRYRPLRAPRDPGGVLRAAYAVPTELVQSGARCWLEFADGARAELPVPVEGAARMRDEHQVAPAPVAPEPPVEVPHADVDIHPEVDIHTEVQAALEAAQDQVVALNQRIAELERARDDDRRVAATSAAQAQTRLEAAEQRAQGAEHQLETTQARAQSADQEARAAEGRAQAAEAQIESLTTQAEAARSEAASATARVTPLERRVAELEQAARTGNERIETLERELAQVTPARQALELEVAKLRSRQSSLELELDRSRDQLRIMTSERDELGRQAAAFDGVAVKARERAAVAEAANEKATATLQELQIWRGELERRLAETTSELGATRAARETDERELMRLRATLAEAERRDVPNA